jgi:hypothetical protein
MVTATVLLREINRECGAEFCSKAAAAPATVSGEPAVHWPLGLRIWEGDRQAMTREPGDLPSVVVTGETHRTG